MNIGILGTGKIAVRMAQTLSKMSDADSYAVASRKIEKAKIFAEEHGFQKFFGSYEELVSDPKVDIIYVATPHSHHFEHAKLAIEHGKHVLCEKAFTMNAVQAEELLDFAEKKGVCITEAIWTRYMPSRKIIDSLLEEKVIGEVRTMTANLCHPLWQNERVSQPELAGGALLDMGIYPLNFALMHFGNDFKSISSTVVMTDTGVDGQECVTMTWEDGKMAVLNASMYGVSDSGSTFWGTKGYMVVDSVNRPLAVDIYDSNRKHVRHIDMPQQHTGYEYEVQEFIDCIRKGEKECPSMTHEETLRVMRIMDGLRKEWGLVYPQEQ